MGVLQILLILINVCLAVGILLLLKKRNSPTKEDPRLSKGLQLLQSKISILEDLSDRTDKQVNDLCALLDRKIKDVQTVIAKGERQNQLIRKSMQKSLEVAKIFEDKIPHEEILERQNQKKYIEAARLAHKGMSVAEIAKKTGLPQAEVRLIVKVNKDNLRFEEEKLPPWAQQIEDKFEEDDDEELVTRDFSNVFENRDFKKEMQDLGERFRQVESEIQESLVNPEKPDKEKISEYTSYSFSNSEEDKVFHKVEFPKVDPNQNLE